MYDLMIVGCGPVGAVAANLAGAAGLSTIVVERAAEIFDRPRAIHFDAHVMRILQQAGVADDVLGQTRVWERSTFYGSDGNPIRVHDWARQRPLGWDAHYLFYQPTLEQTLRARFAARNEVTVKFGTEVVDLDQDDSGVSAAVRETGTGRTERLAARYLLAADGATSFVRTQSQIELMDQDFDEPWMVIDLLCDRPLGSANESEMFCDPKRPATRVPGPGRHHRWEFMLLPGESAEEMESTDSVAALLAPWVSLDEVQILRASVYRFHALVAERWRDGRLFLCGDAAHQTPPFLGQGMCHGIRDVQNLIWKLAAVLSGADADDLLESFEAERRPHVETIIEMAVNAGRDICLLDSRAAAERDARTRRLAASGELPSTTFQGMPPLHGGLFRRRGAGELFPQPRVRTHTGKTALMDDVVGAISTVIAPPAAARELSMVAERVGAAVVVVDEGHADHAVTASAGVKDWLAQHGGTIAVLRPDHYLHTVTDDVADAAAALREMGALTAGVTAERQGRGGR